MNLQQYNDEVMDYLEYIGYPDYVEGYNPDNVADSIFPVIAIFYTLQVSQRLCALTIFGITWEKLKYRINIVGNYKVN